VSATATAAWRLSSQLSSAWRGGFVRDALFDLDRTGPRHSAAATYVRAVRVRGGARYLFHFFLPCRLARRGRGDHLAGWGGGAGAGRASASVVDTRAVRARAGQSGQSFVSWRRGVAPCRGRVSAGRRCRAANHERGVRSSRPAAVAFQPAPTTLPGGGEGSSARLPSGHFHGFFTFCFLGWWSGSSRFDCWHAVKNKGAFRLLLKKETGVDPCTVSEKLTQRVGSVF
jgi:hypothetical protein